MSKEKAHRKTKMVDLELSPLVQGVTQAKTSEERKAALRHLISVCRAGNLRASPLRSPETVPEGCPMERWLAEFKAHSIVPAELCFWIPFQILGHWLMHKGAKIDLAPETDDPKAALKWCYTNTYIMHCGPTGVGKNIVEELAWEALDNAKCKTIPDVGSCQKFLGILEEYSGRALLQINDEFPLVWERLRDPSQGPAIVAYLRAYRQQSIELPYLKKTYECPLPLLSLMNFAQPKELFNTLEPRDYNNGFVRRHIMTFAPEVTLTQKDQHRYDPQIVARKLRESGIVNCWRNHVRETPVHKVYTVSHRANEHILWHVLDATTSLHLEAAYATTALYTARKFALIYHYLMGDKGTVISKEAAEFATALTKITLHDTQYLLDEGRRSPLSKLIEEGITLRKRIHAGELKGTFTHRKLGQNLHLEDASTAKFVYEAVMQIDIEAEEPIVVPERTVFEDDDSWQEIVQHELHDMAMNFSDWRDHAQEQLEIAQLECQKANPEPQEYIWDMWNTIRTEMYFGNERREEKLWEVQVNRKLHYLQARISAEVKYAERYKATAQYEKELDNWMAEQGRTEPEDIPLDGTIGEDFKSLLGWETQADVVRFKEDQEFYDRCYFAIRNA